MTVGLKLPFIPTYGKFVTLSHTCACVLDKCEDT